MKSKGKSIKTNFVFNSLYQISGIIVPLITLPYLSRVLHASGLGSYSFAYSVAYYFYIFIKLGLQNYGNRTIAYARNDKDNLSKVFSEIYVFQLFMAGLVISVYAIYVACLAPNKLLASIFLLLVMAGGIDLTWLLYGLEEFIITSARDIIIKIATAICIFMLVKTETDVWKYALIYSAGGLLSQLVVLPYICSKVKFVTPSINGIVAHIKPNLFLFLPTIAVSIYKTMDKIMLGSMTTELELGYYHSCESIISVPLALITALGTVMLPRMSNMISVGKTQDEIGSIFDKSIIFAMFMSSSVCMGIMTVAVEFVPIFYGVGFEKCVDLFYVILPSCLFLAFANVIRTQYILPRKKDALFIKSLFSGAMVNLLLNSILIPEYASVGAAIGTLAAEIVVCVVQVAAVFKEANMGRNIINSIPFIVSGLLMFVLFRKYTPNVSNAILALVLKVAICGGFYVSTLGIMLLVKKNVTRRK